MIEQLTGLGYAIIGLAITIGIGIVILSTLSANVATCLTGNTYNATGNGYCSNATSSVALSSNSGAYHINVLSTYLGTSSGGLASWVPIIIVLVIGMLFLGAFLGRKGGKA